MNDRLPSRLARRERNVPIPTPDNVDALAATLTDWGAEHRPKNRAPNVDAHCGGPPRALTCAPSASQCHGSLMQARERIDNVFPRTRGHETSANTWSKPPPGHGVQKRPSGSHPFETPARPEREKSNTRSLRGQPGVERFLCGALYTVFLCSSTLVVVSLTVYGNALRNPLSIKGP